MKIKNFIFIPAIWRPFFQRDKKRGVALLLAVLSMLIVSLVVVAFFVLSTIDLQITTNHYLKKEALYIAEAGVETVIASLRSSGTYTTASTQFPSGSGHYYDVTYSSSNSTITSVGRLSSGERATLSVKVGRVGSAPYTIKTLSWREV